MPLRRDCGRHWCTGEPLEIGLRGRYCHPPCSAKFLDEILKCRVCGQEVIWSGWKISLPEVRKKEQVADVGAPTQLMAYELFDAINLGRALRTRTFPPITIEYAGVGSAEINVVASMGLHFDCCDDVKQIDIYGFRSVGRADSAFES